MTGTPSLALADGTAVWVHPVLPHHRARLQDELIRGFEQLSDQSRTNRFLSGTPRLTSAQLRHLVDDVDDLDHVALVLRLLAADTPIGVGRFIRDRQNPESAEVAITVLDSWQGQGAGTLLLTALAQAATARGIRRFTALVQAQNSAPLAMMRHARVVTRFERRGGVASIVGDLP